MNHLFCCTGNNVTASGEIPRPLLRNSCQEWYLDVPGMRISRRVTDPREEKIRECYIFVMGVCGQYSASALNKKDQLMGPVVNNSPPTNSVH